MNKTILIPTDFSKVCDNAVNHGAKIAQTIGARLVILHVLNADSKKYLKKNNLTKAYIDDQLSETQKQLEKAYGIIVHTTQQEGKLNPIIAKVSKHVNASIIVFGTHGKTGMQNITGSHAMKLIHSVNIPVLVVQKRTFGMGYFKIVFPINVSTNYDIKIDWTIFIANAFHAQVDIFSMKTENVQIQGAMDTLIKDITTRFDAHQVQFTINQAAKGIDFPHQINEFAVSNNADLIMIKVDNDEFEPSFILGAQEEKMIFNSSQIPVFCAQNK